MKSHASMNRIYRLVWNAALNVWVAVAENAKGRGKGGSARTSVQWGPVQAEGGGAGFTLNTACRAALMLFAPLLVFTHEAYAADAANASVTAGSAGVSTVGNTTTINQASQRVAIDWTSLSTHANEALIFNQPNAQAIALNRITGSSPSELLGSLTANGQVFILNPNGVLFGAGSQVNVGGLVASTLNMRNADFMAGNHVFTNSGGTGAVVNQGAMTAAAGGYLALLAPEVRNEGVMTASLGTALLAAGNKVTLNIDNGSLLGYSIDQGAINALAENKLLIKADGGQVLLSAKAMDNLTTATVNNTGVIEAKTIQNKAGRILLMGDMATGTVNVAGTLDASAPNTGGIGGDGGFIETSAAHVKVADGAKVTTLAGGGKHGTWLIDPVDFTIADSGGDISGATLGGNLGGGNVVIQSVNGAAGVNGDVNVNSALTWNAGTTLTLNAVRNININASVTSQHADGKLVLEYGQGALTAGNAGDYIIKAGAGINLAAGQNFSTRLGADGVRKDYTVITSLGAEGSTTGRDLQGMSAGLALNYALGGDIDAAATALWESGAGFMPIASGAQFTGTFAGLGHSISHLTVNRPGSGNVGLIAHTETGAMVRDVGLVDAKVSGYDNVGALVGRNENGAIRNSYATGSVWGGSEAGSGAGGLVGNNVNGSIRNSYSTASVAGKGAQIGGLVGLNWMGTIGGSYATGDVTSDYYTLSGGAPYIARGSQIGGLLGNNYQGTVSNSYATGNVSASGKQVGGLVGMNESGTITNSHASGNVVADRLSLRRDSGERVGGLAGENYSGTISNSYATGNVSAPWIYTGGLVGYNNGSASRPGGTIINSYATGNVSGIRWVGGLVGYDNVKGVISNSYATGDVTGSSQLIGGLLGATTEGTISNTYATGKVTLTGPSGGASDYIGGLIGSNTRSNVTNSYWNRDTSGQGGSAAGTGLSNAQFQQQASFSGFDFGNTWVIYEGHTTPLLRSFMKALTVTANVTKVYDGMAYAFNAGTDARYSAAPDLALLNGTLSNSGASEGAVHVSQSGSATTLGGLWSGQQGYLINYANSSLTITPKAITVAATGVDKVYNGDAVAAVTLAGTGMIAGDVLDFTALNASFSDKNTGAGKTVTVSGISIGGAGAGDYSLAGTSASTTANITRKAITVAATADNKTYDGNVTAGVSLTSGDVVAGDTVNFSNTAASFDDKNAGTAKTVTVSGISAGGADADNYSINSGTSTAADITRKAITVTAMAAGKVYDGSTAASVALASSGLVGGDMVNFANTAATFGDKNAGTAKAVTVSGISASGADAGNYSFNSGASANADVTRKALTVTGVTAADKVYDQGTGAAVNAAGTVYTGLIGGDVVSISVTGAFTDKNAANGKTVNLSSSYSGADVGNYAITSQATTTASISQAALTISGITAADKTYNTSDAATVNTAGASYSGLFAGDVVNVAATGLFGDKNAGTNKTVNLSSSYSGADVGNYAITGQATTTASISQAGLTLSTADVVKTYDAGTGAAGVAVVTGGTLYGGDTLSGGSFAFANKNASIGNKVVNVSGVTVGDGVNNGNYNVTYADNTTSTINKATLTVTGVAADNKTYDASNAATLGNTGTLAGLMSGEALTLTNTGATFADKNAGTGKLVTATYSLSDGAGGLAGNYQLAAAPVTTTANIDKAALTVSGITAADKIYNASTAATVNTAGAAYGGLFSGDVVNVAATGLFSDKNAGANKTVSLSSSYSGADVGNYTITNQANTTATINQAALTVSGITAADKIYNASTAATVNTVGAAYGGLFSGDVVSVAATGLFSDKNAGAGKTVNLSSSYSGADAGNYAITSQASTTATISQAALTVSGITAADKTYNANDTATVNTAGASYSGLFGGDVVNVAATGLFSDKNAGVGKTVTLSSSYTGADAGNYTITNQTTTTASISQAALSISGITAADKTYNASDAATVNTAGASYGGLFAGDVVSVNATGVFSDKNAGTGKTVTLASSYGGADAGNYAITGQATTTANIGQAGLTLSTADVVKTYDAGTGATGVAVVTGGTLYGGDTLSGGSFAFANKNASIGNKVVNVSGVTVGDGVNNGNYNVTYAANATSTINRADLTVQAAGTSKVYDGTTAAAVAFSGNGLAGDVLNVTGSASFADKNAGLNKAVSVTGIAVGGADAGNYNLISGSTASTTADITPKQLTVTANDDRQMSGPPYSGGNGVSYSGLVTGDSAAAVLAGSVVYGGGAQGAYLPGEYDITPGGLLANGNYSLRFMQGRLTLGGGDAASAALGGTALVGAYQASLNMLSGDAFMPRASLGDSNAAAATLNSAAAEEREGGE